MEQLHLLLKKEMNKNILVAPSILSADFSCLREEIRSLEDAGADQIHLDVMDGHFVPNITFGPVIVRAIRKLTYLPLNAHLMITHPSKYIKEFIRAGCNAIGFHLESEGNPVSIIETLHKNDVEAGLVINPETSVDGVIPYINKIDFILVMSVHPGFAAQEFIPDVTDKIKELRRIAPQLNIAVDGGINDKTVDSVIEAGANIIISASFIFSSNDKKAAVRRLRGEHD